ncbi:unnamed protein product [Alopecurus aequalis]
MLEISILIWRDMCRWTVCDGLIQPHFFYRKPPRPTKKRTATVPLRRASYCIHVLRITNLRLKLFAVENMPIRRSRSLPSEICDDFNISRSKLFSKSSNVGKPLAIALASSKLPEILTSVPNQGSKP